MALQSNQNMDLPREGRSLSKNKLLFAWVVHIMNFFGSIFFVRAGINHLANYLCRTYPYPLRVYNRCSRFKFLDVWRSSSYLNTAQWVRLIGFWICVKMEPHFPFCDLRGIATSVENAEK